MRKMLRYAVCVFVSFMAAAYAVNLAISSAIEEAIYIRINYGGFYKLFSLFSLQIMLLQFPGFLI